MRLGLILGFVFASSAWAQPVFSFHAQGAPGELIAKACNVLIEADNTESNLQTSLKLFSEALEQGLDAADTSNVLGFRSLAFLRLGDLAQNANAKLGFYDSGRREAEAAIAADPRNAAAHFFRGATLGRAGMARGVVNSLFMLGDVRREFETTLALDPQSTDARLALGKLDEELPGILGGSQQRAEKTYRQTLKMDPHFTRAMVDLARVLSKEDRKAEAVAWAQRVLDETQASRPGECRKFDRWRARALLDQLNKK